MMEQQHMDRARLAQLEQRVQVLEDVNAIRHLKARYAAYCDEQYNKPYCELGANYFDERRRHYTVDRLASRLERLGYWVHLEPVAAAAA